jgi:hypothetical protein
LSENSPNSDTQFWERFIREKPLSDLQAVKDAAKQLVTITSALQALLLAVLPLKDIRSLVPGWKVLLFMIPSLLWLGSLVYSIRVFVPEEIPITSETDPTAVRDVLQERATKKVEHLKVAQVLLVLGLGALIIVTAFYFLSVPAPKSTPSVPIAPQPSV